MENTIKLNSTKVCERMCKRKKNDSDINISDENENSMKIVSRESNYIIANSTEIKLLKDINHSLSKINIDKVDYHDNLNQVYHRNQQNDDIIEFGDNVGLNPDNHLRIEGCSLIRTVAAAFFNIKK